MAVKTYLRIAAGILLAAAIAAAAAVFFVPRLLNIDNYRAQILSMAQKALNRHVSYETASISRSFPPTVVFRSISVAEKSGDTTFLEIGQLTFKLALLPLLHKEVHLREVVVERPVLTLSRDSAGVFNFHDLITGKPSEYKIHLKSIRIINGRVHFTDRSAAPEGFTASLEIPDLYASGLARGDTSTFKLSAMSPDEREPSEISISGTARIPGQEESLRDAKLDVTMSAKNVNAGRYWPYYGRWLPFERVRGELDIEGTFKGKPIEFATKGTIRIRDLRFNYPRVFHAVLTPQDVRLAYDVELTPKDLAVKSFDLSVDGLRVTGSCAIGDMHTEDPRITARAATSRFGLEDFRQYIPYGIIVRDTADFIERNIKGGIYRLDEGRLDGRVSRILHMERGDNYNVLYIRGRVEKGLVTFGPRVPTFNNIKGDLQMRGKDFLLRGMTGNFGGSPFTLEGKIADYPLDTPASYPFTMVITPAEAEIAWLFRQEKPAGIAFSGRSLLQLSGAGHTADYRLAGSWDLTGADYRYRQLVHKPAGMANRLRFSARLGKGEARLEEFRYELPPLDVTADATYRYHDRKPLTFSVTTNRFMVDPIIPIVPVMRKYHPSGSTQAHISGSGNPAEPDGITLKGDVTLAEFSGRPLAQIKPLSGVTGTIHLTESALETEELTGRIGNTHFAVKGRVAGFVNPAVDLTFSSPGVHPEDLGYHSPGKAPEIKNLSGSISLNERNLTIASLSGQVHRSTFTISGKVLDIAAPKVTLRADFPYLVVEDLAPLTQLRRSGEDEEHPRSIVLKAHVTSAAGRARDIPFEHLDTELSLDNDQLAVQALRVGVFGGTVSGSGKADFAPDGGPMYQAHYRLAHVDAAKLMRAAGGQEYFTGTLAAEGELAARGSGWEQLKNYGRGLAEIELSDGTIHLPAGGGTGRIPFKSLQSRLIFSRNALGIQSARIEAFGGVITGRGEADFGIPDGPGYELSCNLAAVEATEFFNVFRVTKELSGRLTLQADLTARGDTVAALEQTLNGSVEMHMEKGIINKYRTLSKVFSILNVSQLLDFRLPDMVSTGMPYDRIDVNFSLQDGIASTSDLTIDSPSLDMTAVGKSDLVRKEIDLKIGVQPLQTVGKVVNRIPIIGWILTGGKKRLFVVYFDARGPWEDPKVSTIEMSALPRGVYNIFKRAFNLPETLVTEPGKVILGN
jgi:uncharacterized protein involved in outer membrane biogenesis